MDTRTHGTEERSTVVLDDLIKSDQNLYNIWRYPDRTQGGNPQNHIFSPTITKLNQFQIILFTRATISKAIITMLVKVTKVYYLQSSNIQSNNNHISKRNQVDQKPKYIISKETNLILNYTVR